MSSEVANECPVGSPKACPFVHNPELLDYHIDHGDIARGATVKGTMRIRFLYQVGKQFILYEGDLTKEQTLQALLPLLKQQVIEEEQLNELQCDFITV